MRVEILSEHPDDMLTEAERERRRPADEAAARVEELREERRRARASGRWLEWARLAFAVPGAKREATRQHLTSALPTGREEKIRAGRGGERRVARELGEALDDEWILFRGYRNARGEIDGVLVGPRGVFAIEEKYRSVRVFIHGDSWTAERIDKYGKPHGGRFQFRDRGGRSPSRQVREPADALSGWLGRNKRGTRVKPVVLLSHPNARIGTLDQPAVRVERSVGRLLALIESSGDSLDAGQRADVERLIRRDHAFHEAKRKG